VLDFDAAQSFLSVRFSDNQGVQHWDTNRVGSPTVREGALI
jgi:hypothetical protein